MKNYVLVIFLLLFISCGSSKKTTSTKINNSVIEKLDSIIDKSHIETSSIIDISKINGSITILEIEYDTSTLIDSITNRPKIKNEKKTFINFQKKDSIIGNNTINDNTTEKINSEKSNNINIDNNTQEDKKESNLAYYLYKCLFWGSILTILIFIVSVYKKMK